MSGESATVFGLDVSAEVSLPFLEGGTAEPTGRPLKLLVHAGAAEALEWPAGSELISDQVLPDGSVSFRIEAHPDVGYLIWGPAYGAHRLSGDGRLLECFPQGVGVAGWQRLLVAQVLPFAAVLNGLEVFHASAVVIDGHAVAILGRSGGGKTSVALELCRRGASFLADDVLALECSGADLLGHPGSPVAGVAHAEVQRQAPNPALGMTLAVNNREHLVRMRSAAAPAPLSALFFLDRRADGPSEPEFEPLADVKPLLGATFNFVLATPLRLGGLLEACALAAQLRVERVFAGPAVDPPELAAALRKRLDGAE